MPKRLGSTYRSDRSKQRIKIRNLAAPAVRAKPMKPDESFVAIDTEIRRVADEIALALARNQNQPDCDPPEVAEWVDPPTEGPLAMRLVLSLRLIDLDRGRRRPDTWRH